MEKKYKVQFCSKKRFKMQKRNVLVLLLLAVASYAATSYPKHRGNVRVAGGVKSSQGQFPYSVVIQAITNNCNGASCQADFCGGALINRRYVLTAAHCFTEAGSTITQVNVLYGNVNYKLAQNVQASNVIIHPEYNDVTQANDIALVYLANDVAESDNVQYVNIAQSTPEVGAGMTLAGWGITSSSDTSPPSSQSYISLSIANNGYCSEYNVWNPTYQICLSGNNQEPCKGDSGSSLVYKPNSSDTRWTTVGITSYGDGSCDTNNGNYNVFTKVSNYASFIASNSDPSTAPSNSSVLISGGSPSSPSATDRGADPPVVCFWPLPCYNSATSHATGYLFAAIGAVSVAILSLM
jgi:trypsin